MEDPTGHPHRAGHEPVGATNARLAAHRTPALPGRGEGAVAQAPGGRGLRGRRRRGGRGAGQDRLLAALGLHRNHRRERRHQQVRRQHLARRRQGGSRMARWQGGRHHPWQGHRPVAGSLVPARPQKRQAGLRGPLGHGALGHVLRRRRRLQALRPQPRLEDPEDGPGLVPRGPGSQEAGAALHPGPPDPEGRHRAHWRPSGRPGHPPLLWQ
mmetsp:Transcript_65023/g.201544  ORF Transcript_65023/g.201544 Transcript_65023/m.201544 type:complete len:212 (+) Transcript_65023:337-972(+)